MFAHPRTPVLLLLAALSLVVLMLSMAVGTLNPNDLEQVTRSSTSLDEMTKHEQKLLYHLDPAEHASRRDDAARAYLGD